MPLFLSCKWFSWRHLPRAPSVSIVFPIRNPKSLANEFDRASLVELCLLRCRRTKLITWGSLGFNPWLISDPDNITTISTLTLLKYLWCLSFDPWIHFSNNLVRLDTQSVALIPTFTVVLLKPCDVVILIRSRKPWGKPKPHAHLFVLLCGFVGP